MNQSDNIQKEIVALEAKGKSIVVRSPLQREEVMELLKKAKTKKAEIVAFFKDTKEKAHATWKSIVAQEKGFTDKLDAFEKVAKQAIGDYDDAQERIQKAEEARLKKIADDEAAAEKKKLEQRAARTKNPEKKQELLNEAASVSSSLVSLPSRVEKAEGESSVTLWKFKVTVITKVPREYMMPNDAVLGALAKQTKGPSTIPGIEFYSEKSMRVKI